MATSFVIVIVFLSYKNDHKRWHTQVVLLIVMMSCACDCPPPQSPLSIEPPSSCICYLPMPPVDLRNVVGETVHTLANRVLGNHSVKNIYGNTNWCKYLMEVNIVNDAYNGHKAGAKNTP